MKKTDLIDEVLTKILRKDLGKQNDSVSNETYRIFRPTDPKILDVGEWLAEYQTIESYDIEENVNCAWGLLVLEFMFMFMFMFHRTGAAPGPTL